MKSNHHDKKTDKNTYTAVPLSLHLLALRHRLLRIVLFTMAIFFAMIGFANELYNIAAAPLTAYLPDGSQMIATDVASPFLTPFKLVLVLALIVAMPLIFYELWGDYRTGAGSE